MITLKSAVCRIARPTIALNDEPVDGGSKAVRAPSRPGTIAAQQVDIRSFNSAGSLQYTYNILMYLFSAAFESALWVCFRDA
jgi:hypothetical protein